MIHGLPERLKELRIKLGLSQREVARILRMSPSIISSYETGERTPSVDMLLDLADLYHCSTDYLLGKERKSSTFLLDVEGLSPAQIRLVTELVHELQKNASKA